MIFFNKRISIFIFLLSISILITTFLTNSIFRLTYYSLICKIWLCYYFSRNYSVKEFAGCYIHIMRIVTIASLICWLFPQIFANMQIFPQFTSSAGANYRFLGVTTIPILEHMQSRNFGPFWEPGTYQVYLCVGIFLLLFVLESKLKISDLILFIITELTTLSGASLIPVGLMLAAYLLKRKNLKAFFVVLIGSIVILIMLDTGTFDGILLKLTGEDNNSSFLYRWIGFEGGIKNFLAHPLFGSSFEDAQQVRNALAIKYLGSDYGSNTNTFANYFGSFGIFVGLFFLSSSYQFFKKICSSRIVSIIAFIGYFFSTSNENLTGSLLILIIAILGRYGIYDDRTQMLEKGKKYEQNYMHHKVNS